MAHTGVVRKWFPEKAIGFIKGPGHPDGSEIFVHFKDIVDPVYGLRGYGRRERGTISLTVGGTVFYDIREDGGKIAATNVTGAIGPRLDMSDPEQAFAVATGEIQTRMEGDGEKGGKGAESYGRFSANASGVSMGKGKGIVREYNIERGFGWITPQWITPAREKSPNDLFVHVTRLPQTMRCPNKQCGRVVNIKMKQPHNEPKVPDQTPVKNGDVEFEVQMIEGKLVAVGLRGWGDNPGIVIQSPLLLIAGGKGAGMITAGGPAAIEGGKGPGKRPGDEMMKGKKPKGGKGDGAAEPEMPTFACDECDTEFSANYGTTVKCPGCDNMISV